MALYRLLHKATLPVCLMMSGENIDVSCQPRSGRREVVVQYASRTHPESNRVIKSPPDMGPE